MIHSGGGVVTVRPGRRLNVQVVDAVGDAVATAFLAHGAGGRIEHWRRVVPGLRAAGCRVVVWDAIGHGRSPVSARWRDYAGHAMAEDLLALLAQHGGACNIAVGHSYGTRIVLRALVSSRAAGASPGVDAAVLLAPPDPVEGIRAGRALYLPLWVLERLRPRLSAGFRALAWGPDAPPRAPDAETARSQQQSLFVFKALVRQAAVISPAEIAGLDLPVTLLVGELDRLLPPEGARRLAAVLPRAQFDLLPRCGHQIPLERADAVVAAIVRQIGALRGGC